MTLRPLLQETNEILRMNMEDGQPMKDKNWIFVSNIAEICTHSHFKSTLTFSIKLHICIYIYKSWDHLRCLKLLFPGQNYN